MIGEAVGAAQMGTAMSIDVGANNASRMVGPTIGGLLLASVGIGGVFTLSVALYAIAVVAACRVRYRNSFPPAPRIPSSRASPRDCDWFGGTGD